MYSFEPGLNEVAINQNKGNNIICTLGFKF